MQKSDTLIIGAGPSGLALASKLTEPCIVVEAQDEVGGLCRSHYGGGATFDIGGHSFHTPHTDVREFVREALGGALYEQKRDARVFTHGALIPYPFQKFYTQIPNPDLVRECDEGLSERSDASSADDFEEYIVKKFGYGIAKHFMLPYNRKLWARDIKNISCEWTSERIADVKGKVETFDTRGGKRKPLQADTQVAYPAEGGFVEIFKSVAQRVNNVQLNERVVSIDANAKTAITDKGTVFGWNRLVSTMPIPILLRTLADAPLELIDLADQLEYMSLRVEFLVANSSLLSAPQRIYVADPNIPPHKIALNHHSSESLRGTSCQGIMAEISYSEGKPMDEDSGPKTVQFLRDIGILNSVDEIIWRDHILVKYAYPVYTHKRPAILSAIMPCLASRGIHSLGRFGEWEYINSDKCIKKGFELAKQMNAEARI